MAEILFLAHRIPYPPNKGDKIRSWHFLEHLTKSHKVHLGFFVDDKSDLVHTKMLGNITESISYQYISPLHQKVRSLMALLDGRPLTLAAYPTKKLQGYVNHLLSDERLDAVFLFSSAMGQFIPVGCSVPVLLDLVDVDSEKWGTYAEKAKWPLSSLYKREFNLLSDYEVRLAADFAKTLLVSEQEANLLRKKEGAQSAKVVGLQNGVDTDIFNPDKYDANSGDKTIIFTGAMNYLPNIEAVEWFCKAVWPLICENIPSARFVIAGGPSVARVNRFGELAGVEVLGYVEDMAKEIAQAAISVAPLLTARGIQNKVLEAMAMAKPVVATSLANEGIEATDKQSILVADDAQSFADCIMLLLDDPVLAQKISINARDFVVENFSWGQSCRDLDKYLDEAVSA